MILKKTEAHRLHAIWGELGNEFNKKLDKYYMYFIYTIRLLTLL